MPKPNGNLFTPVIQTVAGKIRSVWGSNSDRMGVVNFPPDFHDDTNFTQVSTNNGVINGTAIIYTVPANKTFYWQSAHLSVSSSAVAFVSYGAILVTDAADVAQYYIIGYLNGTESYAVSNTFVTPLVVQTGYKIKIVSTVANLAANGHITGFIK